MRVKIELKSVLSKMLNIKLNLNISSKNNMIWCVNTEIKRNENRSGVSLSLIFTVWYS
ncbi:hypothetical protein D9M72_422180 [compost metagenome]